MPMAWQTCDIGRWEETAHLFLYEDYDLMKQNTYHSLFPLGLMHYHDH